MYWLQYSDFYDWPHIQYFDNGKDLEKKLESADFTDISLKMQLEYIERKYHTLKQWCQIVKKL